ncbi:ROK family transcriptional regulator [Mycolicibacterium komossense]|uniref:ROK family protein n=1 Tax=Mycolicibacterium komossense TaxID=1779 RepID=A0ABT3C8I7_9MYCO|nr:ROK family transcriptional regulator [Mycolicibacterium komossense]MCV7225794.1 ROK family protein [Mycolicibacterium komossense]
MTRENQDSPSAAQQRWFGAAQLIALARAEPGITRAAAAGQLGISTGGAADLVARLRKARLLDETPAPAAGRGRPTTILGAHPDGPQVLAAELRAGDWRLALAGLDGQLAIVAQARHAGGSQQQLLADMAAAIAAVRARQAGRIRAVAVSVAGTVSDARLVQFTTRGWTDVDLSVLTAELPGGAADIPLLLGNDATLAGLAEARTGAARGAGTALHVLVAVGLGGTLVVNGEPVTGAHGAAGEYGHVPFGDRAMVCPCGARGCWDLSIDGRAVARHLGDPPPDDPVGYAHDVLGRAAVGDTRTALESVASALGAGIGGLVNLHDPDVVTLSGLAVPFRAAAPQAFSDAYRDGLMAFRKSSAPPVRDGDHGDDGSLRGATTWALDHITTEIALAQWAQRDS